jgi:hypothetical protein
MEKHHGDGKRVWIFPFIRRQQSNCERKITNESINKRDVFALTVSATEPENPTSKIVQSALCCTSPPPLCQHNGERTFIAWLCGVGYTFAKCKNTFL